MMIKSNHILAGLVLLVLCAGCGGCGKKEKNRHHDMRQEVDIPMTDESFCSLFDGDLDEFSTELDVSDVMSREDAESRDFTWVQDTENADGFMTVHFGFDRHGIAADQREALLHNVELAKARMAEDSAYKPTFVVEGHSCHSAGHDWYNMLISERRANRVCDALVKAGIPRDCIKVVGRGAEVPAMINGEMVTGDRMQQAPNRRCEMRVIYA